MNIALLVPANLNPADITTVQASADHEPIAGLVTSPVLAEKAPLRRAAIRLRVGVDPRRPRQQAAWVVEQAHAAANAGVDLLVLDGVGRERACSSAELEAWSALLRAAIRPATAAGVTLAIENAGPGADSRDLWFLRDNAGTPKPAISLNLTQLSLRREPITVALPRLAAGLRLVQLPATVYDPAQRAEQPPDIHGDGTTFARLVELLKGVGFDGWLVLPPPPNDPPGAATEVARWLVEMWDRPAVTLTAYKGDKNAPRYRELRTTVTPSQA